ncbi:MAG: S-methyl-5'-thioadenosine phosphorylase [Halobacteriovoraceae bacterium]|nr:S-methyl-5'-thioadenosine phosphorylase [Halobacteriovoraceae bacterium]
MEMGKIGIIGGSGVYNIEGIEMIEELDITTPFGKPSNPVIHAKLADTELYFIPRHGKGHVLLPSEVNYRANIFALKSVGVEYIISISAVGSLKEELPPTTFVLVDQFIDWTKGKRERTFFEDGIIGHVSCADPIDLNLQKILESSCKETGVSHSVGGSYICIEGPQFSSRAESNLYRSFGASVIGMTNVPESYLAKEAGIAYATVAMVTDYDCWKDEHCTVDEIMKVMETNNVNVQKLLMVALPMLRDKKFEIDKQNQLGVLTPESLWSEEQKKVLEVLLK